MTAFLRDCSPSANNILELIDDGRLHTQYPITPKLPRLLRRRVPPHPSPHPTLEPSTDSARGGRPSDIPTKMATVGETHRVLDVASPPSYVIITKLNILPADQGSRRGTAARADAVPLQTFQKVGADRVTLQGCPLPRSDIVALERHPTPRLRQMLDGQRRLPSPRHVYRTTTHLTFLSQRPALPAPSLTSSLKVKIGYSNRPLESAGDGTRSGESATAKVVTLYIDTRISSKVRRKSLSRDGLSR